jgi:hypothetical protein
VLSEVQVMSVPCSMECVNGASLTPTARPVLGTVLNCSEAEALWVGMSGRLRIAVNQ